MNGVLYLVRCHMFSRCQARNTCICSPGMFPNYCRQKTFLHCFREDDLKPSRPLFNIVPSSIKTCKGPIDATLASPACMTTTLNRGAATCTDELCVKTLQDFFGSFVLRASILTRLRSYIVLRSLCHDLPGVLLRQGSLII